MDLRNYSNDPRRPNFSPKFSQNPQNYRQYPSNMYQNPQSDPLYFSDPGFQQFMYQTYQSQQQNFANFRGLGNNTQEEEENLEKETGGNDYVEEVDPIQAAQISQQSKKVWSLADDEALISSYMNNNCDAIIGTNQKKENLWKKVMASYNNAQLSNPHRIANRNSEMLKGRWRRITVAITKWVTAFEEASSRKRSGINEEDVVREAHIIYTATNKSKFPFYDHWRMLKKYPKWDSIVRSTPTPSQQCSGDTNSSEKRVRLDDDIDERFTPHDGATLISDEAEFGSSYRPEGVKNVKNKGKKKVSHDSVKDQLLTDHMTNFNLTISERNKVEGELKMQQLARQMEAQEKVKKYDIFNTFIARGVDNLSDIEKQIFNKLARELGFLD